MSLSDRIRPDCEAAPWVIKEVKEMESEIKRLKDQNDRYREALQTIANGDLAPSLIKEMYIDQAYQKIAEKALKGDNND